MPNVSSCFISREITEALDVKRMILDLCTRLGLLNSSVIVKYQVSFSRLPSHWKRFTTVVNLIIVMIIMKTIFEYYENVYSDRIYKHLLDVMKNIWYQEKNNGCFRFNHLVNFTYEITTLNYSFLVFVILFCNFSNCTQIQMLRISILLLQSPGLKEV